jgi:SAM-dependent methyltransferase
MLRFLRRKSRTAGTGLGLRPGDEHYRAFVGPPEDYDLVAAMAFNLLTSAGLRQHHRLLDVGCGSLRIGRLLIPYLNQGNYCGVEPNRWLVNDGILNEVGRDQIRIKEPAFCYSTSLEALPPGLRFDYALAQSIFSHCTQPLLRRWLAQLSTRLEDHGALFATFCVGERDCEGEGWVYPACVTYRPETIAAAAAEFGFRFEMLDWRHPRQAWALFSRPSYDQSLTSGGVVAWNRVVEKFSRQRSPAVERGT